MAARQIRSGGRVAGGAPADELPRLRREALDLMEERLHPRGRIPLVVGVADGREIDEDVGRCATRCRLAEQRRDVEVARCIDVAPARESLCCGDEVDAGFDATER